MWTATVVASVWTATLVARNVGFLVACLATVVMCLWPLALGGGQTESFAALPSAAAFFLAARGRWAGAGISAALALVFSFQALPVIGALAVLAGTDRSSWLRLIGSGAAVGAVVLAVFLLTGTLANAIDVLWSYNRIYLGSDRTADLRQAGNLVIPLLPLAALLPLRRTPFARIDVAAAAWLVVATALLSVQGRLLTHYFILFAVPMAILANPSLNSRTGKAVAGAITGIVIAFGVLTAWLTYLTEHSGPATARIGAWVQAETATDSTILDWGVESNVYLASQRAPAGRYPYLIPLVTPGYTSNSMIHAWVADLAAHPPAIIVDSESANPFWQESDDFLKPPPPGAAGGRTADLLDPFRGWVRQNYQLAAEIDGRKIYRLVLSTNPNRHG